MSSVLEAPESWTSQGFYIFLPICMDGNLVVHQRCFGRLCTSENWWLSGVSWFPKVDGSGYIFLSFLGGKRPTNRKTQQPPKCVFSIMLQILLQQPITRETVVWCRGRNVEKNPAPWIFAGPPPQKNIRKRRWKGETVKAFFINNAFPWNICIYISTDIW